MAYHSKARLSVEVLRFDGDLSVLSMIKMKGRINRLLNRNQRRLLLDLSETRRVELAGLEFLWIACGRFVNKKGTSSFVTYDLKWKRRYV